MLGCDEKGQEISHLLVLVYQSFIQRHIVEIALHPYWQQPQLVTKVLVIIFI